jgi:hypothetical protein
MLTWSTALAYYVEMSYMFYNVGQSPGPYVLNFLRPYFTNFRNKLECFSLASLSSIVSCFLAKQEPTLLKNFSGAPLLGRLLSLPTNNRLGWKGFQGKYVNS